MLLAIDIGNTNITLGVFEGEKMQATWRMTSMVNQMADELFQRIDDILNKEKASHDEVDQALDEKGQEAPGETDATAGDTEEDSPGDDTTEGQSDSSN